MHEMKAQWDILQAEVRTTYRGNSSKDLTEKRGELGSFCSTISLPPLCNPVALFSTLGKGAVAKKSNMNMLEPWLQTGTLTINSCFWWCDAQISQAFCNLSCFLLLFFFHDICPTLLGFSGCLGWRIRCCGCGCCGRLACLLHVRWWCKWTISRMKKEVHKNTTSKEWKHRTKAENFLEETSRRATTAQQTCWLF